MKLSNPGNMRIVFRSLMLAAAVLLLVGGPISGVSAETKVTWYGQAAFKIVTPSGGVILIDPWLKNPKNPDKNSISKLDRVDYILLTHGHGDHVGNSVQIAKATGATLVTAIGLGNNVTTMLGYPPKQATTPSLGNVGGTIELPKAGARVTIVNAVHASEIKVKNPPAGSPMRVASGNPIGLVVQVDNGPVFYHTGDTDVFTDMKLIARFYKVDVMLAAIGGHFTMDPRRAAVAVEFVKPKIVMPMHYGTFGLLKGRPHQLQAEMDKIGVTAKMVVMQPGDTRNF